MIISDSFVKSVKARDMEFTTNSGACIFYIYNKVKVKQSLHTSQVAH